MTHSDAFSQALQTDDIGYIRSYYGFFRKPTETEFVTALVYNAHRCIEFMTPKFFRSHSTLSFDLLQTAAQSNRVDVLRCARQWKDWSVYTPGWGLGTPHCGREAAHFLLDQWQGSTSAIVQNWKPTTQPTEHPIFPQREDGPFTLARLSENNELFERLVAICQDNEDVRTLLQEQLLDTTRTHYSHCNFDAIFIQPNSDVFFDSEQLCLGLLRKSVGSTFPSTVSSVIRQPQLKKIAAQHIEDLCGSFFADVSRWHNEELVWGNAKGLFDVAPQVFLQHWADFYFVNMNPPLIAKTFNNTFVEYAHEAVEALIARAPENYVWDTHSLVGSHVLQHKLKHTLNAPLANPSKRKM